MEIYQIIILIGLFFLILELFLPNFIAGAIAIGFFAAAVGAFFDISFKWQLFLFSFAMMATFFLIRPFLLKYAYRSDKKVDTNKDALIGRKGRVVEAIDNNMETGAVALDGDTWRAKSIDGSLIPVGELVVVIEIESIILFVKPLK